MKWRVIGEDYKPEWHDCNLRSWIHPILNLAGRKPITINIICKNTNTKREIYDWLFQRYNLKLWIAHLIGNVGGKEYAHPKY